VADVAFSVNGFDGVELIFYWDPLLLTPTRCVATNVPAGMTVAASAQGATGDPWMHEFTEAVSDDQPITGVAFSGLDPFGDPFGVTITVVQR